MVAPRALVFRPLVKGNEALGTRLPRPPIKVPILAHAQTFDSSLGLVPINPRVSILDPVFLRQDPKWRSKQRRTIAILACACANDVPVEFIPV